MTGPEGGTRGGVRSALLRSAAAQGPANSSVPKQQRVGARLPVCDPKMSPGAYPALAFPRSGETRERACVCLVERLRKFCAIAGLAESAKEAQRAEALPEWSMIYGWSRGVRRQRWMSERTRVGVVLSERRRTAVGCRRCPCLRAPRCGTSGRVLVMPLRRCVLLSTAQLQG